MTSPHHAAEEVTHRHLLLGYSPLIIGVILKEKQSAPDKICLTFVEGDFAADARWQSFPTDKNAVGRIELELLETQKFGNSTVGFYKGVFASHRLISAFHQFTNAVKNRLKTKAPDNIGLEGNLYDQVRLSYSFPRKISLILLMRDGLMNCFPTDLHGALDDEYYVGSLRIGGKADDQVLNVKKVVIAELKPGFFKDAYAMGKNHMREMKSLSEFELNGPRSKLFQVPLVTATVCYRELEWFDSFDYGVHRIHFCRVINRVDLGTSERLAHVHQYYVQWCIRKNKQLSTLIR